MTMNNEQRAAKSRPMLFSAPMVREILEGRKTQTRRVVKDSWQLLPLDNADYAREAIEKCPYGVPGDELWVKETHQLTTDARGTGVIVYQADDSARFLLAEDNGEGDIIEIGGKADRSRCQPVDRWRPSIHMFRKYSRLTLRVLSVRVEWLQDISEADAKAEGVAWTSGGSLAVPLFEALWKKINGPDSWHTNPWVWVVEFEKASK